MALWRLSDYWAVFQLFSQNISTIFVNILTSFTVYTAALHALILIVFYLLISGLGYPGLVVFQQKNIFLIKNKQQETLHQQQAAGEAQQTHSVEITIKPSGSKRQTVSAYRQQPRAVHPVRRDESYISKKGERIWTPRKRTPT